MGAAVAVARTPAPPTGRSGITATWCGPRCGTALSTRRSRRPVYARARAVRGLVSAARRARRRALCARIGDSVRRRSPLRRIDHDRLARRGDSRGPPAAVVLFVGRHVDYKGVRRAAARAAAAPASARDRRATVRIEAAGSALARRSGSTAGRASRATFPMTTCGDASCRRAALVLPSITRAEAFGVVQLEAMAAGMPVVSTDLPTGVPWVNQHGVTGLVVPPGDAVALRPRSAGWLADAALRRARRRRGRARVVGREFGDRAAHERASRRDSSRRSRSARGGRDAEERIRRGPGGRRTRSLSAPLWAVVRRARSRSRTAGRCSIRQERVGLRRTGVRRAEVPLDAARRRARRPGRAGGRARSARHARRAADARPRWTSCRSSGTSSAGT